MEENNVTDIEYIESYMLGFGGGEIYISKKYWNDGIAVIYLNHLKKRNAISGKMMVDFRRCLSELETWKEGKAVLLCGVGENFCSGGDLDIAKAAGTPTHGSYMSYIMQDVLKRFRALPLVTFSLVHGPALGGGAEIAIFSDYILVTDNVKLGFVQGKIGIVTAFGGATRLTQLLGERKAMELLLTSKICNAEECLSISIASKKVSTDNMMEEALNYIRRFTIHHYSITQTYKQVASHNPTENCESSLILERKLFAPMWGSELNREALNKNIKHVKRKS